jgi:flagellin-like hook-associated protein FlgL
MMNHLSYKNLFLRKSIIDIEPDVVISFCTQINIYAKLKFPSSQMRVLRQGLEDGISNEKIKIAANSEFNGIKLMAYKSAGDGSGIKSTGVNLQVGLYANEHSSINLSTDLFKDASVHGIFKDMTTTPTGNTKSLSEMLESGGGNTGTAIADLGSTTSATKEKAIQSFAAACCGMKYTGSDLVLTDISPKEMLAYLDAGINEISGRVTKIGAAQNRVDSAITALDVQSQNITASLSTLRDTDVAEESSNYIQAQILQQASATLLSTANQLPSMALNLI